MLKPQYHVPKQVPDDLELPMDQEQDEEGHFVAKQTGNKPKSTQGIVQKQSNEDITKNNPQSENNTNQLRQL